MSNKHHQENRVLRGPLIFTVPASHFPFLVALNIGWLDVTERTAEAKRRAHNLKVVGSNPTPATTFKPCSTAGFIVVST
jgi:hypothetical protein